MARFPIRSTLVFMIAVCAALSVAAEEADDSSKLTATVIVPKDVPSFQGLTLQLMLFEVDPRRADAAADKFDEVKMKEFSHTTGEETSKTFVLGEKPNGGKVRRDQKYYLVTDVVDAAGKRTHYGDCSHRKGLCSVLTSEFPKKVEVKLRKLN